MGDFILKTCTAAKQTLTESIFFFFGDIKLKGGTQLV